MSCLDGGVLILGHQELGIFEIFENHILETLRCKDGLERDREEERH